MSPQRKVLLQLAVLAAAAAGLWALTYFGIFEKDAATERQRDVDARLLPPALTGAEPAGDADAGGLAPARVVGLTVFAKGATTVLERGDDGVWRITAPVAARADRYVVDALVRQLETARFRATLDERPDASTLARYGLDPPRFWVDARLRAAEGAPPRTLRLEGGLENAFDGSVFMRRAGESEVHAVEGGVRVALERDTLELRDKRVLALDEGALASLALEGERGRWRLERRSDGAWSLVEPARDAADEAAVRGFLDGLGEAQARGFLDTPAPAEASLGLDRPAVRLAAALADGGTVELAFGRPASDAGDLGDALALRRVDADGTVFATLAPGALAFERTAAELRDRSLLSLKKELVTRMAFAVGASPELVVEKASPDAGAESWRVVAPVEAPAKVFRVTSALWTLTTLRATELVSQAPDAAALERAGLGPDARRVSLFGADGALLGRVVFGREHPDKRGTVFARGASGQLVELDGARLGDLPWALEDLTSAAASGDAGPRDEGAIGASGDAGPRDQGAGGASAQGDAEP